MRTTRSYTDDVDELVEADDAMLGNAWLSSYMTFTPSEALVFV